MLTPASPITSRQWYCIAEAVALTGLSRPTICHAIKKGRLRAYKPTPQRVLIAVEDLDRFVRSRPAVPEPTPAA